MCSDARSGRACLDARDNNRFLDKRISQLEAEVADRIEVPGPRSETHDSLIPTAATMTTSTGLTGN